MRIGEKREFETIEPGVYRAELIDYTDTKPDGTPLMSGTKFGESKPQWQFKFELEIPDGEEGRQLSAWINKPADMDDIAPNANITLLAQALLPNLTPADEWDLPDLLHKRCRIQVETFKRTDGTEGTKIGKYYPLKAAKAEAAETRRPTAAAIPF